MNHPPFTDALDRRKFLQRSMGAVAALGLSAPRRAASAQPAAAVAGSVSPIIDVNVNVERWPFRKLYRDDVAHLVEKLRSSGITEAWAGSFDGLLHKDIASVNSRLADTCRQQGQGLLIPFGSVNPTWTVWEEDVRRCHEVHKMPGIRLHPGFHGYALTDARCKRLLQIASERGLIVQLALIMEDERTQHPLVQAPAVDASPLLELVQALPKLKLVILNGGRAYRGDLMKRLAETGRVFFDISWLEGSEAISDLYKVTPATVNQMLFGSHAPLFPVESPLMKLKESDLNPAQLQAISFGNARRMLGKA